MPVQIDSYNAAKLEPVVYPQDARLEAARLGNSLTLAKGTVLGKKTADNKLYAYAEPNQVQTVTIAGTLSGGTFRVSALKADGSLVVTDAIAYNANAAAIQTALNAVLGTSAVAVAGTVGSHTITFSGTGYAGVTQPLVIVNAAATTGATTVTVADSTTYDGTETAVAILVNDVKTDASGNHYLGDSAVASAMNLPTRDTSVYVAGTFLESQLTGWNANALKDFGARRLPAGYIRIP